MKVLILNPEFPPLGGGAGNATNYLLREFAKNQDLVVDVITSSVGRARVEQFSERIKIIYLDIHKGARLHYQSMSELMRYLTRAYWVAQRMCRENKYDVVHVFFGIPSGLVAHTLSVPYLVSLRGSDVPFYNPRFRWMDFLVFRHLSRWVWAGASGVVANSGELKRLAQQTDSSAEIKVFLNGVDTEEFFPAQSLPEKFTVLSTSRLIRRKGVEYLIEGFALFHKKHSSSNLVLVGDGDLMQELQQLAENLGVKENVSFKGVMSHTELPEVYRGASVFVLPSLNEGMSNSLLEAMASGLPIVTTDTGGTAELVDQDNGIVVEKENSQMIADALQALCSNDAKSVKMGEKSRAKAEDLSWKVVAEQYLSTYQRVMDKTQHG